MPAEQEQVRRSACSATLLRDRALLPGNESEGQAGLLRQAARWAADDLDIVQLREKDFDAGVLADLARRMLATSAPTIPRRSC